MFTFIWRIEMANGFLWSVLTIIAVLQWSAAMPSCEEVPSSTTGPVCMETQPVTESCTKEQTVTEIYTVEQTVTDSCTKEQTPATCPAEPTTVESCPETQTAKPWTEKVTVMETCPQEVTVEETCTKVVEPTKPPGKPCEPEPSVPEAISQFNKCFEEEVQQCETLRDLFDIENTISVEEFMAGKFYLVTAITARAGSKSPVLNAVLATRYITSRNIILKSSFLIAVYSDSIAKSLYTEGKLDCTNAPTLAKSCAEVMKAAAEKIVNDYYPRSKVTALPTGYANFFIKEKVSIADVSRGYGDEWKYQLETRNDIVDACKPLECCSEVEIPLQPCNKFCAAKSDVINQFKASFYQAVKSCKTLTSLFEVSPDLSPAECSKGTFYVYQYVLQQRNVEKSAVLADFMSRYILKLETVSFSILVSVHAQVVAKYLLSEGRLTEEYCSDLAAKYAKVLEDRAKVIVDQEYPRSKLVALALGTRLFLVEVGLLDASKGTKFAYYYGSEWYCQSCGDYDEK